jgi:type IV pilus assembly protein PilW
MSARFRRSPWRQRGVGIVETMVGILIGMVVVLAIYNVFALAEGYKRTTVGVADAQTTGLVAQFILAREIGNAGTGLSIDAASLVLCRLGDPNWITPPGFFALAGARAIRPVPVLIRDGGAPNTSEQLVVTYATPIHVVNSVLIVDAPMATVSDPIYVQSPNGFRVNDRIIVNAKNAAGDCETTTVTAVTPGDSLGNVTTGMVGLSHPALAKATYIPSGATDAASVLNLGQVGESTRTLFDVAGNQLRSTDLLANAPAVPIAQNVVLLKAQYGVDCAGNGVITWTSATASGVCGRNYTPDDFMPPAPTIAAQGMNTTQYSQWLSRIRAVRIAVVVRSDEPDLKDPALVGQTATLFDCSAHNATCQGSIAINNATLADGWRHRIYETIVPMRNAIYNNGT